MHSFGPRVAAHSVHPHEVGLLAIPNILALRILPRLRFKIIQVKVKRFGIQLPYLRLPAVVKVDEGVTVGLNQGTQKLQSLWETYRTHQWV